MLFCGRFLGLCATKTVIFGDTRTGSKRAVWLQQDALLGKERWRIQFPIDMLLKNPSKPRKNLTVGGKSEDFCTEHAAASQMMGSAGTKFSGEQTSWELWGSLSHPGTSQTEVQEDVFSWLFGYVCWTRMDLTHLPQGLVTQGLYKCKNQ